MATLVIRPSPSTGAWVVDSSTSPVSSAMNSVATALRTSAITQVQMTVKAHADADGSITWLQGQLQHSATWYLITGTDTPYLDKASVTMTGTPATCPWTGAAWTWNDLLTVIMGVKLTSGSAANVTVTLEDIYLTITYTPCAQVTVDTLGLVRDADMRHVIENTVVRVPATGNLQSLRFEIANDAAGSSVVVDSAAQTWTAVDGQAASWVHTWTPSTSGTYWLRVGVICEDNATTWWAAYAISISIPTITGCTVQQQGEYLYATVTLSDPTSASGMMFYAGGDGVGMQRDGAVMSAHLWVGIGDIAWSIVVMTPWASLMQQGVIYVSYVPQPGIHVYDGDAELNASDVALEEPLVPDVPTCRFTTVDTILATDIITVKAAGRRWRMTIDARNANDDGSYAITCKDRGATALARQVTLSQLPSLSWGIALRLGLQWAADYTGLLSAVVVDAQWADTAVSDVLQQLGLLNSVSFAMRDGVMYALPQNTEPVSAISKGQQQDCSQIKNHIREEYVIADYPSPASLLTTLPTAWTGTAVAADYVPITRLRPPSRAVAWLHATGAVSTTLVGATIADYDRAHGYWVPAAAGATLTIRLEQDANNYLEKTITYAGTMATGWLAIADNSQGVASHVYARPGMYASVTLQFDEGCTVRVREITAGADVYATPWREVGTEEVTIPLNMGLTPVDSLVVEVTDLHVVDTVYGVRCVAATLNCWDPEMVPTGTATHLVWQTMFTWGPGDGNYTVRPPLQSGDVYTHSSTVNADGSLSIYASIQRSSPVLQQVLNIVPFVVTESAPLYQELDIALADFTKTGNPVTLAKITLTATGEHYYDAVCLVNTRKTRKAVDVYTADWSNATDRPWNRKTDQWRNPDVARAFATALLAVYANPLTQYTETVDWDAPVQLGDVVTTPTGDLVVSAVVWDPATGTKTLRVGQRVRDTLEWMQSVNQSVADLKRMV